MLKTQRNSGWGTTPSKKKDGLAAGRPHESMLSTKKGLPYSGPNVAKAQKP